MNYEYRPIEHWPGDLTQSRRSATFRSLYGKTLDLLESELIKLGAEHVILQVAMTNDQIRLDGRPKSGAKPFHPGVIVSFKNRKGEDLSFPCDKFDSFEDNLRAIALSLQALRAVDRYGVTRRNEQYRGWIALPETSDSSTRAATLLSNLSGVPADHIIKNSDDRERAYKLACKKAHPDTGGNQERFLEVLAAMRILREGKAA